MSSRGRVAGPAALLTPSGAPAGAPPSPDAGGQGQGQGHLAGQGRAAQPWSGWAWRAAILLGALLVALALPTTERYASDIESLAGVDWLETRPPLDQAGGVPSSSALARGAQVAWPALAAPGDVVPYVPVLQAPSVFNHWFGSIRDAADLDLVPPPDVEPADLPAQIHARALVFYRQERAAGWIDMMTALFEIDNGTGQGPSYRTGDPDGSEAVWVRHPSSTAPMGQAAVLAQFGVVAVEVEADVNQTGLQGTNQTSPRATAQAEVLARELASRWRPWLTSTLGLEGE